MPARKLKFEDFELDLPNFDLRQNGLGLKLEKIPMEVLVLLAERRGQLVTREEIAERIWGEGVFVDTEHGINTAIRKIRLALKDDPDKPRFVQTVLGRGYKFVANAVADSIPAAPETPSPSEIFRKPTPPTWLKWVVLGAGAFLAFAAWFLLRAGHTGTEINSIAVLPLENVSGDPALDYLSDGITDELITDLAKIKSLKVVSRTSMMHYKRTTKTIPQIARELKVDAVLEGTVLRSGDKMRISAQLIEAGTDHHLWAESYERHSHDIINLEGDVALAIAHAINVALTPQQQATLARHRTVSTEAYDTYLKGRYQWNQRTETGLIRAIEYFRQAADLEPQYAEAYSGLADSYTSLGYLSAIPPRAAFPPARAAAERALALDPELAEPHASLAYVYLYYDWNWAAAEHEFKLAIAKNPNYPTAHDWYSNYLTAMDRPREAQVEIEKARELDPFSPAINTDRGFELYYSGHYDEAIRDLNNTLEMNPKFPLAHFWAGRAYTEKGMLDQSIDEFRKADSGIHDWPVTISAYGYVAGLAGHRAEAELTLKRLSQLSHEKYVTPYGVALVYAGLGKKDEAFVWLNKAMNDHSHWLVWLKLDPRWNSLRQDPRFNKLLEQVGFKN